MYAFEYDEFCSSIFAHTSVHVRLIPRMLCCGRPGGGSVVSPRAAAKLDDVAEQTSQPKAYFVGAALVLIALLTFLLLPPVFIMCDH